MQNTESFLLNTVHPRSKLLVGIVICIFSLNKVSKTRQIDPCSKLRKGCGAERHMEMHVLRAIVEPVGL